MRVQYCIDNDVIRFSFYFSSISAIFVRAVEKKTVGINIPKYRDGDGADETKRATNF